MVSDESTQMITDYKNNNPYSFIFLRSSKALKNINVRPSTYFYSKKGKLVAKQAGEMNEKQLIEMINKIIE